MTAPFPSPAWHPTARMDMDAIVAALCAYLGRDRNFSVYSGGTCVVSENRLANTPAKCNELLGTIVTRHADFKVRSFPDGNFLVGFRGPVVGVAFGDFLRENITAFRSEAFSAGTLPGERFVASGPNRGDDLDLVAGLYVRARLYEDYRDLMIARVWSPNTTP